MSPGSIAQLSQSDAIAFRVKFEGPVPKQSELYWRGPVMSQFDGRQWRAAQTMIARTAPPYQVEGRWIDYEVTLENHGKFWLFALELPETLPPESGFTDDLQLLSRTPVRNRIRYALRSFPETPVQADALPRQLRQALNLPPGGNPRTRAIAAEWQERHGNDSAAILAAAEAFFNQQLLAYTLNPPLLGADSVDEFLFDTKRGFCEHFASSFVFALRAAGVPARVVAGYQGGEVNPVDGYLVVRQYDAHAWTEVWLAGRGWVRVDPTAISAPRRIADNMAAAVPAGEALPLLARTDLQWLREIRIQLDAVTNTWNQWVLGYNPQRQRDFLQSLGLNDPDWRTMTAVLAVFSGGVLLILTAWILYQRVQIDPARRAWLRFTKRLVARQIVWHEWEGPHDFARRAADALPAHAETIHAIAHRYARLRYAATPPADALAQLNALISSFRP
jgi:transglutaminase-like putative cysteine protease